MNYKIVKLDILLLSWYDNLFWSLGEAVLLVSFSKEILL